nr:uncharacterized protein LOC112428943 isoform X2 [Macaca nemestrina]
MDRLAHHRGPRPRNSAPGSRDNASSNGGRRPGVPTVPGGGLILQSEHILLPLGPALRAAGKEPATAAAIPESAGGDTVGSRTRWRVAASSGIQRQQAARGPRPTGPADTARLECSGAIMTQCSLTVFLA